MAGQLPSGWKMGASIGDSIHLINANMASRRYRSAQAVMVFLPHGSLNDADQMDNLKV